MRRAKVTTKRTIVILGLALAGCRGPVELPATMTPQTMPAHILATTATYPLLQEFAAAYSPPGTLLVLHSAVADWETIYARLVAGEVPFALTTFLPFDAALWAAPVGWDGIAIIVHPSNTIPVLTLDDLRLVIQGRIKNWAALAGADLPVTVISREAGADTRLAFDTQVMNGQSPTWDARLALSSQSMVEIVASTPGAVGYVSAGWLAQWRESQPENRAQVRVVPLAQDATEQGVLPEPAAIAELTYPLCTPVLIVGHTPPESGTIYYAWFAWMQSDAGQLVAGQWYSPG